jgi:hypothetical protein
MMALPHAVITTPVSMPLNSLRSSSFIIEGNLWRRRPRPKDQPGTCERPSALDRMVSMAFGNSAFGNLRSLISPRYWLITKPSQLTNVPLWRISF